MKLTLDAAKTIVSHNLEEARETAKYDHRTSEYWPTLIGERLWFLNMLNNIEVEPKHGYWIWEKVVSAYTCSLCHHFTYDGQPNYCPYCGADMREVEINIDENWYSDEYRRIGEDERDEVDEQ